MLADSLFGEGVVNVQERQRTLIQSVPEGRGIIAAIQELCDERNAELEVICGSVLEGYAYMPAPDRAVVLLTEVDKIKESEAEHINQMIVRGNRVCFGLCWDETKIPPAVRQAFNKVLVVT